MALKIVMMATGTFALPTFRQLIDSQHEVVALVTQPDRTGRGHHNHVNPLKELALQKGIEVFQPVKANLPESLEQLRSYNADLFVVAAYGQILSAELLSIPRLGAINLHGSLLPKYRGAAPIQYSIWKGETRTGVTIFQIDPKLDAGPILGMLETEIGPKETSGQLHDRLAELSAPFALDIINQIEAGTVQRIPQDSSLVTQSPRIRKEEGQIDWGRTSEEIGWHVRAMQPWPAPYTFLHHPDRPPVRLLILDVDSVDDRPDSDAPAGTIEVRGNELLVRTGSGMIRVNTLQPAGKRAMSAADYLRGTNLTRGRFGPETSPVPSS